MRIKHILVTTDLSAEAERAFQPAADLARLHQARITLLHLVPDLTVAPHGAPFAPRQHSPEVEREIQEATPTVDAQAKKFGAELEVEVVVKGGEDLAREIAEYAGQNHVDLIALSTHGRSGFRRLVLGSVAEAVLRHASVPVLCFPKEQ